MSDLTHRRVLRLDELYHLDRLLPLVVEVVEGDLGQLGKVVALRHYVVRRHQALQCGEIGLLNEEDSRAW